MISEINQWQWIEYTKIYSNVYGNVIYEKDSILYHWHKDWLLKQIVLGQLDSLLEKDKIGAESHTTYHA